jgi:hypothetical protein
MEKRVNKEIENYIFKLKQDIKEFINVQEYQEIEKEKINELVEYVNEYQRLTLTKEDFIKRKRLKNVIPAMNRCNARRCNGEQCTRRSKDNSEFCGTHCKGIPHGMISEDNKVENDKHNIELKAKCIKGIIYYIDEHDNVFNVNDILEKKENPRVIAKLDKQDKNNLIFL